MRGAAHHLLWVEYYTKAGYQLMRLLVYETVTQLAVRQVQPLFGGRPD